jgi:uncharacterized protein (DUF2384 family)
MADLLDHRKAAAMAVAKLVERLADFYNTPEEVARYLTAPQPLLGGETAIDLIAAARGDEVHRLLDQIDQGVYL